MLMNKQEFIMIQFQPSEQKNEKTRNHISYMRCKQFESLRFGEQKNRE